MLKIELWKLKVLQVKSWWCRRTMASLSRAQRVQD